VIVGSGSAGGLLTERLSRDPLNTVLLVEAGPKPRNPALSIPLAGPGLAIGHPRLDWRYRSEPDRSVGNRQHDWPRGRMLGGSSRLNGMVYVRGAPHDYDRWAANGCTGWDWAEIEPHFRSIERLVGGADDTVHGREGDHAIHRLNQPHALTHAFLDARFMRGSPDNSDYNGVSQEGASVLLSSSDGRWRSSSASGPLAKAMRRKNVKVVCEALADRVEIKDGRAHALAYSHRGRQKRAEARRKIVLCAGTIGSPSILLRSGIGAAEDLAECGIPTIHNAPGVGRNLHEHPAVQVVAQSRKPTISTQNSALYFLKHGWDWAAKRGGLLSAATYEAIAFMRSSPECDHPDLQMHFAPYGLIRNDGKLRPHARDTYMIQVNLSYPKSRGQITLSDVDPSAAPTISSPLLADDRDAITLRLGVSEAMQTLQASAFADCFDGYCLPDTHGMTEDEITDWLPNAVAPSYHPAGTCRMGTDPQAVVDPALNVRGVTGLSVADASILPAPISGNIQACVMMIASKAASEMIHSSSAQSTPPL